MTSEEIESIKQESKALIEQSIPQPPPPQRIQVNGYPKQSSFRGFGLMSIIFGVLLFVAAAFAYIYPVTDSYSLFGVNIGSITSYPYRDYTFPLLLCGVAALILGFALMVYRKSD